MKRYRSYKKLKQIAFDIASGRIVTAAQIMNNEPNPSIISNIFLPLALMNRKAARAMKRASKTGSVAEFYGDISETFGRAINGWPVFSCVHTLSKPELDEVLKQLKEIRNFMRNE